MVLGQVDPVLHVEVMVVTLVVVLLSPVALHHGRVAPLVVMMR